MCQDYRRTCEQLEEHACKWWPDSIKRIAERQDILPVLINSQDRFISILTLVDQERLESIFELIESSNFPANLFLKHLIILTDFGSEPLQRINRDFNEYFPDHTFMFYHRDGRYSHTFTALPARGKLTNKNMKIDFDSIQTPLPLSPLFKDLIFLLLFGSNCTDERVATILRKCLVGNLLGKNEELREFIKQRYIYVSRITGGSQANTYGQAAQVYAKETLERVLGDGYSVVSNGTISGITQNQRTETTFDLVVAHDNKYVAVEISFQETTNSTIERKAGQAQHRFEAISDSGNYICYIIDGAGNFQRHSALQTICNYSHCTVAFTDDELNLLGFFIRQSI